MATIILFAQRPRSLRSSNLALEERVRDRNFELQVLLELSQVLGHALGYPELLRLLVEHSHWVMSCDVAAYLSLDPSGEGDLTVRPLRPCAELVCRQIRLELEAAAERQMSELQAGESLRIHRRVLRAPDDSVREVAELASTAVIPVHAGEHGPLVGLLLVGSEEPDAFPAARVKLLEEVVEHAERTVARLRTLLNEEQRRLEQVVASLPVGVILLDKAKRAKLVNPQARVHLEALGEIPEERPVERIGDVALEQLIHGSVESEQVEVLVPGNPDRVFGLWSSPVSAGPERGGQVVIIQELTQQRSEQARIEEQGRLAAVGQLAAGIAHDFNNLLTSVIGHAELLLMDHAFTGEARDDVSTIRDQGRRAAQMIRQILDFSRRSNPTQRSLDLARVIRKTSDLLARTIPEHVTMTLDLESGLFPVLANTTQLQQVLTNLAVNARDAMPDGGELGLSLSRIEVGAHEPPPLPGVAPGSWALLRVRDSGIGMSKEVVRRIFEPFFTTKPAGKGTGLGLAQAYGIIQQHGGHVEVNSRPGEGTTFAIWFPLLARQTSETGEELPSLTALRRGETALVVEDDPQVLAVLRRQIGRLGYSVATAANGREGLAVFERLRTEIRLVITDLTMPVMGGVEFYQRLRALDDRVPVVVLTGYPFAELVDDDAMRGVGAWVSKPPTLKALTRALDDARCATPAA